MCICMQSDFVHADESMSFLLMQNNMTVAQNRLSDPKERESSDPKERKRCEIWDKTGRSVCLSVCARACVHCARPEVVGHIYKVC